MHGLIFRTIESFVRDNFGVDRWEHAVEVADLDIGSFEAMLNYDAAYLQRVLKGCSISLDRAPSVILEDIGTYLVTHENHASVRRLMRFGGDTFVELLHSLDDLPGRTRLAITGLDLPTITVKEHTAQRFTILCEGGPEGFGHVLVGLLRAMADDYGALALLDFHGVKSSCEVIEATVVDVSFAEDRGFSLADVGAGLPA